MDLTTRQGAQPPAQPAAPSLIAYDRDHINALLTQLGTLDQRIGVTLPKTRLSQGMVSVDVPSDKLLEFARLLRDVAGFEMLTCVTAVDMIDHIDSIYHFRSLRHNWLLQVRARLSPEHPEVDSLVSVYTSANWLEREQYDLVGVIYLGHPDLRRILLEDEFMGHPLLKSFGTTPPVRHDPATTQVPAVQAISGEGVRRQERIQTKRLNQGTLERVHPGMTTLGGAAVYLETGQGVEPRAERTLGRFLNEPAQADEKAGDSAKPAK